MCAPSGSVRWIFILGFFGLKGAKDILATILFAVKSLVLWVRILDFTMENLQVLEHLPDFRAFRFRGAHTKGLFVEHLKVSDITVPDGAGEKSGTDSGVYPKIRVTFHRKNREIKTGDVFIVEILQYSGEAIEKCIKFAVFRQDHGTPVLKKTPDIR